ncbi:membrane protein insertase YidC [Ruminococcus sp. FC2018]|uniref:membrane protein insertase YidC n=1 Tax=Ruminococcus sp. FC2018 TaxID=1410617 RepID=UPI000687C4EE|nr:membrane protein insertase YidC [Ruminococcus sp. FC2018]
MGIIATPLGWIMKGIYHLVKNYGIALLLFTFVTRLIVFPMSIKQQKSTAKMGMLAPELEKLKKKYGKNQQKFQEEQMALYAKAGVNPMASCLPMIITMVILFALIPIIYGPLTYISDADKDELTKSNNLISGLYVVSSDLHSDENKDYINERIEKMAISEDAKKELMNKTEIEKFVAYFKNETSDEDKAYEQFKEYFTDKDKCKNAAKALEDSDSTSKNIIEAIKKHPNIDAFMLNEEYISKNLATSRPELMTFSFVNNADGEYADVLPDTVKKAAKDIDYRSFGLDMGVIPSFKDFTWIIPVASFVLQVAVTVVAQLFQRKNNPTAAKAMGMGMKITFIILPVFSLWIGFSYPAGLGLYWCYSSLFALLQTIVLNIAYSPAKIAAIVEEERERNKKSGKKTLMERMAEQQLEREGKALPSSSDDDDDDDEQGEKKLSKAEKAAEDRRKIAEARRRMAEKYGDEYEEFLDDEEEQQEQKKPQSGKKKKNRNKNNNNNNNSNNNKNTDSANQSDEQTDADEQSEDSEQEQDSEE